MTRTNAEITLAAELSSFYVTPEENYLRILSVAEGIINCIDEETEEEHYISISDLASSDSDPVFEICKAYKFSLPLKEKLAKCTHIELNGEVLSKITQDQQKSGVYVFADDEGLEYEVEENTEELLKCKFFVLQEIN